MERLTIPSNLMRSNSETSFELARDSARQLDVQVHKNRYTRRVAATTVFATVCSFVTLVVLTVAIATDHWIVVNGAYKNATDHRVICNHTFLIGLWRICRRDSVTVVSANSTASARVAETFLVGDQNCTMIHYSGTDESATSEGLFKAIGYFTGELSHGSSLNSAVNMKMSSWAFLSGLVLLATSCLLCLISVCDHETARITTILSGVILILSGVGDMCGLIIYIQSASSELASRSRQKEHSTDGFDITYHFSFSFALAVCTFFCAELIGVFCLYIYVKHYRHVIALRIAKSELGDTQPCATTTYHNRGWIRPYAIREYCNYHNRDPRAMMEDIRSIVGNNVHVQTGKKLANSKLSNHSIADSVRPPSDAFCAENVSLGDQCTRLCSSLSRSGSCHRVRNGGEKRNALSYADVRYNSACSCDLSSQSMGHISRNGQFDFYDLSQHNPSYQNASRPPSQSLPAPYRKTTIV